MKCFKCGDMIYFDWFVRNKQGHKIPLEPYMKTNGDHVFHECMESEFMVGGYSNVW